MKIASVSLLNYRVSTPLRTSVSDEAPTPSPVTAPQPAPVPVSARLALAQMPKVSFGEIYADDDLSPYYEYDGPPPPQIEIDKFNISRQVHNDMKNENYLSAINGKLKLASICKYQGKESDAFILEESIRHLYKDMPIGQRNAAKRAIADYNKDMAKYIDNDIENL